MYDIIHPNYAQSTLMKNAAHRKDMNWVKSGHKEYMDALGVTIKYNVNRWVWEVFFNGERVNSLIGSPIITKALYDAKRRVSEVYPKLEAEAAVLREVEGLLESLEG